MIGRSFKLIVTLAFAQTDEMLPFLPCYRFGFFLGKERHKKRAATLTPIRGAMVLCTKVSQLLLDICSIRSGFMLNLLVDMWSNRQTTSAKVIEHGLIKFLDPIAGVLRLR